PGPAPAPPPPPWLSAAPAPLLLVAVRAGCSSSGSDRAPDTVPASGQLPTSHVHGVGIDPGSGSVLVATHEGLVQVADGAVTPVGPTIDLMGFAVVGPDHYLASGHPGLHSDLPNPVGLIETTDAGRTWSPLSRQAESDFHGLTVSDAGVLGFDGSLLSSGDGRTWEPLSIPAEPHTLAASPDGTQVLATTEQGLLRSTDAASSWSLVEGAPLLQVVTWIDEREAVGATPAGAVWVTADRGMTWQEVAQLGSAPEAVTATSDGGEARVVVATTEALLESSDGGRTFETLLER
ncbi:F510_1955 family glycosylhydrolase, partial [Modestobacter marinus]|uniref:F510_1955 family glycosylhydrolase n=1 Tax=Modestobacter marinus TaxID=477641 RepID=UPI0028975310